MFPQVFGLDYMIDEEFKTWLIEVNTNPCLELSSPLLARIIPSMIENAFRYQANIIGFYTNLKEYYYQI